MTDIEEIVEFQKKFDMSHGWTDEFDGKDAKFFERLQYATIALAGEVGEYSNFLKKIIREKNLTDEINEEHTSAMKEELVDIFIYLVILSIILKVDIAKTYYEKMKFNQQRFQKFEKTDY